MAIHKLTQKKVDTAKEGIYGDGGGLMLFVSRKGTRRWIFRYTCCGRRREMGIGGYPVVTLEEAREKALKFKRMAVEGVDPIDTRRREHRKVPTFLGCSEQYIRGHKKEWSTKHAADWMASMKTYVYPVIGEKRVANITRDHVLKILRPIWEKKTVTAKRVQNRIETILDFAIVNEWRDPVNPARWQGYLDKILPAPSKVKKKKHLAAMPYQEIPEFMRRLRSIDNISSQALQLLILTATRTSEVIGAKWDEIDLDSGLWTIPAGRMKAGTEHRIPLPGPAKTILSRRFNERASNGPVFHKRFYNKPLPSQALWVLMRDLGYGKDGKNGNYVVHGFRSSFRNWAGELSTFPSDVIERALAHTIPNKTEAAYYRTDLLDKRKALMDSWAEFCLSSSIRLVA